MLGSPYPWGTSPVPMCPSGRILAALNGQGCASPLPRVGQFKWRNLASPVRYSSVIQDAAYPFSESVASKPHARASATSGSPPITALSIEFVAKPQEAHRVQAAIPAAIAGALKDVTGFAGCLVMDFGSGSAAGHGHYTLDRK